MNYLSSQEILIIHACLIEEFGGRQGIRRVALLFSLAEYPKTRLMGQEMYKGVFQKAGVYLQSTLNYRPFIDCNEKTAFALSVRFLFLNGYKFLAKNKEVEEFILRVVSGRTNLKEIINWFRKNSQKIS